MYAVILFMFLFSAGYADAANSQLVTVTLVSPSWNTGLPTAVARGAGLFRDENLEVRPVTLSSSGPIMMALMMSGQTDLVISGATAIFRGIARGAPVIAVSGHHSRMNYALISVGTVRTISDLKGKAIGITGFGGMGEFAVVESLKRQGLVKDRDYTVLNIEGGAAARMAALKAGKVHAVPVTPGQRFAAEKEGFKVVLDVRDALSEIPSNIVTSTKEFAASHGDIVVRFLRALAKSTELIRRDKDKAIALAKANGLRGDAAIERKALDYYADDLDLRLKKEQVAVYLKLLDVTEPPEKFFDDSFLTRAIGSY
jgi:ABC-type nitrate/sulfonate/bicarbonate transport system substrate-binding protein